MTTVMGRQAVRFYGTWTRLRQAFFTGWVRRGFAAFGKQSVIMPPCSIASAAAISIGRGVVLGPYCKFLVDGRPTKRTIGIVIDDGVSIQGFCTLSAFQSIVIEKSAMFARGVYISDHDHAYEDVDLPVKDQGVKDVRPVRIGSGSWLGENVVVCPGVTVGVGAVVAAHSIVRDDVPPHTLVAGAPAQIIRSWAVSSAVDAQ